MAMLIGLPTTRAVAGEVRLWPTAALEAGADVVTLADVAALDGFDEETLRHLSGLIVSPPPRAGGAAVVRMDDLRAALDAARVNLAEVTFLGAARCTVAAPPMAQPPNRPKTAAQAARHAAARARRVDAAGRARTAGHPSRPAGETAESMPGERSVQGQRAPRDSAAPDSSATLEEAVRQHIEGQCADLGGRLDIRFGAAQQAGLSLRATDCRFTIRPREPGGHRLGMVWFDVQVARDGARPQVIPVLAEVTLLRRVVVASRIINRGQDIAARDLRVDERPFKRLEDVGLTELPAAIGMEARRALRPGDMLRPGDLRNKPLVKRNQLVAVWSRAGGLVVQSTGRATREGWLGDELEIRAEGSERKFFGTVSGPGMVTVSETSGTAVARR
jgi:flagella basal body P-ring formation protein FlgA